MKLTIFYSWQMDIDVKINKDFIRKCIEDAINNIKNTGQLKGIDFILQESTNNIPGTPNIPETIDERIRDCDIYICDLSIVNKYYWIEKIIMFVLKKKLKYFQNNNAYGELNKAQVLMESECIIQVLNSEFGDPNQKTELMPFDNRFNRFPIQYKLPIKHDTKTFNETKESLTASLEDAIRKSAIFSIQNMKTKYRPFIPLSEQKKIPKFQKKFFTNSFIEELKKEILYNKDNLRIIGLSGLGKTRIVYESFNTNELQHQYLYCDCFVYDSGNVIDGIYDIFTKKEDLPIIVDNCNKELYIRIIELKNTHRANNPIVSIYNDPNELKDIRPSKYIEISRNMDDIVEQIIDKNIKIVGQENVNILKEFSGGIPMMADLLVESIKGGEQHIGRLNDNTVITKLLQLEPDSIERIILRSISLFDYIGIEEEYRSQIQFIATDKNITSISMDETVVINEFDKVIKKFLKREIIEKNGWYIGIRPRPLAFALASEWFDECSPQRLIEVFNSINDLKEDRTAIIEAMCRQIRNLGYNDNAKALFDKLLGDNGPFYNAEVVNTEVGSRFFRSFVEVNPIAVADNLYRNFGLMTKEQLLKVEKGRRNLIWVLEKLCFDKRTFEKGSKLLMNFAIAENENWGNNATNEFLKLFKIQLPGTESSLEERLEIIKWGLNKDNDHKILSLKAIESGLESQYFCYFSGAENQGTKILKQYAPNDSEIYQYWEEMLKIIDNEIDNKTDYADFCYKIIENKARGICSLYKGIDFIFPYLEKFAEKKGYDWDGLLEILYHIKNYDFKRIDSIYHERVNKLIESLTRTDFVSRFNEVSKFFRRGEQSIPFEEQLNIKKQKFIELAQEFVRDNFCSYEILEALFLNKEILPNSFGFTISELLKDDISKNKLFIDTSVEIIKQYKEHEYNRSIIIDYTRGINNENFEYLIGLLIKNNICYLVFPLYGVKNINLDNLDLLFTLVDKKDATIDRFINFSYYCPIGDYSEAKLSNFVSRIVKYGEEGIFTIFTIVKNILYFSENNEKNIGLGNIIENVVKKVDIKNLSRDKFDKYFELIDILLKQKKRNSLALHINNQIIDYARDINQNFIGNYSIENILSILLKEYFDVIWKDLSGALVLEGKDYAIYYNLHYIIGSSIGNIRPIGKLFLGDIDKIFEWCNEYPDVAPIRLASMVPIYENGNIHPIALRLIDNFGDNDEVLITLHSNINTFGWTGSLIPLYKQKKKLFEDLINHKIPRVSKWARENVDNVTLELENEKRREEERKFLYN